MYYKGMYDGIDGTFCKEDMNLDSALFDEAIEGLIAKGLMEKRIVNGQTRYRLTELGILYGEHNHTPMSEKN